MDSESVYKRLQKEIGSILKHHEEVAIKALSTGSIEELRFQGGYITACLDIKAKAEKMLQDSGLE